MARPPRTQPRAPRLPREGVLDRDLPEGEEIDASGLLLADRSLGGLRYLRLRECLLRNVDLQDLRCGRFLLSDVRLEGCNLSLAMLEHAGLENVEFVNCRLTGARFPQALLEDVLFVDCTARFANFRFARLKRVEFQDCLLREADFGEGAMEHVRFLRCDLRESHMEGSRLAGADLRSSDLAGVHVRPEDLKGATVDRLQVVTLAPDLARVLEMRVVDE